MKHPGRTLIAACSACAFASLACSSDESPAGGDHFDVWIDEVAFDDERIGCDI